MAQREPEEKFVERLSRQGEEALGRIAEELIENPVVNGALTRALEAREKAVQAQEAAMGALNIPSAADIERLTRRLRSVSQRLEGIEDALDRLEDRAGAAATAQGRDAPGSPQGPRVAPPRVEEEVRRDDRGRAGAGLDERGGQLLVGRKAPVGPEGAAGPVLRQHRLRGQEVAERELLHQRAAGADTD